MEEAFRVGSGLEITSLYSMVAGTIILAIALWAAWVCWSSWKSVHLGRLEVGYMASIWIQAIAIVAVVVGLVIL